jgi:hypothetical protein
MGGEDNYKLSVLSKKYLFFKINSNYYLTYLITLSLTDKCTLSIKLICKHSSSPIGTTTLSWVSTCSTIVEHSQQEGFTECRCQRHVRPPNWRRTRDLERSNFRHKRPPASEATIANSAAEGGNMSEKWPRILPKVAASTSLLCSFTCCKARHGTDGFTSPPKEDVLRIFSPKKSDGFGRV